MIKKIKKSKKNQPTQKFASKIQAEIMRKYEKYISTELINNWLFNYDYRVILSNPISEVAENCYNELR